jgi:CBS-domain-containing membrane protein
MTTTVVAVRERASYKEIVDDLVTYGVSAMPVLDAGNWVIGVVSEADLLPKAEFAGDHPQARLFERRRRRTAREKADGDTARELMTTPAITIGADASIAEAARLMEAERVKRLPVVNAEGRLVGIVARRDLLRTYLRPDRAIREEVTVEVLGKTLGIEQPDVEVRVTEGVVTLRGRVDRRSTGLIALKLTRAVTGVVAVVDELTCQL